MTFPLPIDAPAQQHYRPSPPRLHSALAAASNFRHTVRILGKLGYEWRKILHAGEPVGWRSLILEHMALKSIIFAAVDLVKRGVAA